MNHYSVAFEIAYRHEQLRQTAMRHRANSSTRHDRRWWFTRRRTISPQTSAPPAPLTPLVPAVGTAS